MTDYNPILPGEIDPESPVTAGLAERWTNNCIAIIEGAAGAPRATSKIITPGGSDKDGVFNDAVTLISPGFFDFTNIELTDDNTTPWISKIRVNGDVSIATGKTLRCVRPTPTGTTEPDADDIIRLFNAIVGGLGVAGASDSSGAGGAIGAGGRSKTATTGGAGAIRSGAFSNSYHSFMLRRLLVGGNSFEAAGDHGAGGGALILMVNGDMELTGATIDCSGGDGTSSGGLAGGGGGGGSIIIICNGNIHDGTFLAKGGNGANSGSQVGGGGGGGFIQLVAASFTGTQTKTVTGGTTSGGSSPAAAGSNGLAMANVTLSEKVINSIMLGAVQ